MERPTEEQIKETLARIEATIDELQTYMFDTQKQVSQLKESVDELVASASDNREAT